MSRAFVAVALMVLLSGCNPPAHTAASPPPPPPPAPASTGQQQQQQQQAPRAGESDRTTSIAPAHPPPQPVIAARSRDLDGSVSVATAQSGGASMDGGRSSTAAPSTTRRVVSRSFLAQGSREKAGYGLYSYILFGSRPESRTSTQYLRYRKTVEAYLEIETSESVAIYNTPDGVNVTYLPLISIPTAVNPDNVLDAYDYARAQRILRLTGRSNLHGPYIVSARIPLTNATALPVERLYQDLTTVPPNVIAIWIAHFKAQSEKDRFWERQNKHEFVLAMRTDIAKGGQQLSAIETAVASLVWRFPGNQ